LVIPLKKVPQVRVLNRIWHMKKLRILIADDHELMRTGTRALIEVNENWEVCGEARNGREAVELTEKLKPDLVVLDIAMPELNGLEATRQIKKLLPETEVLILTGSTTEQLVHDVFESGARSYIYKTDACTQLTHAIETVSRHKPFFTSKISEILFDRFMRSDNSKKQAHPGEPLTPRERETLQLLAEGKTNKDLADYFGVSVKTVETHRAAVMRKLRLESVTHLVRYAIRNGFIEA
jgi:DNA-binding NarL/FixJ family response regulator